MTKRTWLVVELLAAGLMVSAPRLVLAQERRSPLADAPAIRHKVELRDKRFEIGVGLGTTIGQDFYNATLVGGKLGFHLTDWLAIAGTGAINVTKDYETSVNEELGRTLPQDNPGPTDRTPSLAEARAGMNKIDQVFGAQLELIPFAGKLALFSSLFMNYDLYVFGGPGFINFKAGDPNLCANMGPDGANSCDPTTGMKTGANFGIGLRAFFNDYLALNFELRDILLKNNPSGADADGNRIVDSSDSKWDSNFILSLNIMVMLPTTAKISD